MKFKISNRTRLFNGITLRIILLFGTALTYSLLMDYFQIKGMLDLPCEVYTVNECMRGTVSDGRFPIGFYHTHWSTNHYLYFFMNLCLMIVQAIRLISYIYLHVENDKIIFKD